LPGAGAAHVPSSSLLLPRPAFLPDPNDGSLYILGGKNKEGLMVSGAAGLRASHPPQPSGPTGLGAGQTRWTGRARGLWLLPLVLGTWKTSAEWVRGKHRQEPPPSLGLHPALGLSSEGRRGGGGCRGGPLLPTLLLKAGRLLLGRRPPAPRPRCRLCCRSSRSPSRSWCSPRRAAARTACSTPVRRDQRLRWGRGRGGEAERGPPGTHLRRAGGGKPRDGWQGCGG